MSLCDRCKNKCKIDVIEIESCINFVGEAPHKIVTNFDRITESPEKLAKVLAKKALRPCGYELPCNVDCPLNKRCMEDNEPPPTDYEVWLIWLEMECKE